MESLSDMLQKDLTDFLMDIEDDEAARDENVGMKIEDGEQTEDFQELDKKDFVEQEKSKLEESEQFKEVMIAIDNQYNGVLSGQSIFDQVINCNQLITRIDQM